MFGILLNIENSILNGIQSLKILQVNQESTHDLIHHLKGKNLTIHLDKIVKTFSTENEIFTSCYFRPGHMSLIWFLCLGLLVGFDQ